MIYILLLKIVKCEALTHSLLHNTVLFVQFAPHVACHRLMVYTKHCHLVGEKFLSGSLNSTQNQSVRMDWKAADVIVNNN